ncbi:MAG: PIG-L family deacetylase [Paludibacteraceae bacterium]|nr:PIG-L family deacetylase [Paludibacteraceae bacterium]
MKTNKLILRVIICLILIPCSLIAQENWLNGYKKVLVIGAHPDDPETMCGGTMLKLKTMGAEVVSVYLTSGEAGIKGKNHEEARSIRQTEARHACEVMGVKAEFLTQIDGNAEVNKERYAEMKALIEREKPDMVITHWPIDSHRDHRVCAVLVYDAWRQSGYSFDLYYGEVMTGIQTQNFTPTLLVDITDYKAQKEKAYMCHESQGMADIKPYHDAMKRMRGMEHQTHHAEAFIKQNWGK